jgi:hypothetical protein
MISKAEMLRKMQSGEHFSIVYGTANRDNWSRYKKIQALIAAPGMSKKEKKELEAEAAALDLGGDVIEHDDCKAMNPRGKHAVREKGQRMVNHRKNLTRNLAFFPGEQIRTMHFNLAILFNNQEVVL